MLISQHHLGNREVLEGIKRRAFVLLAERVAIRFSRPNQDVPDGLLGSDLAGDAFLGSSASAGPTFMYAAV